MTETKEKFEPWHPAIVTGLRAVYDVHEGLKETVKNVQSKCSHPYVIHSQDHRMGYRICPNCSREEWVKYGSTTNWRSNGKETDTPPHLVGEGQVIMFSDKPIKVDHNWTRYRVPFL